MTTYSKINIIYRLQKWMDSVPGQTFLNYAYSWGASIVILGTLFKLTHSLVWEQRCLCSFSLPSIVRLTRQLMVWSLMCMLVLLRVSRWGMLVEAQ